MSLLNRGETYLKQVTNYRKQNKEKDKNNNKQLNFLGRNKTRQYTKFNGQA